MLRIVDRSPAWVRAEVGALGAAPSRVTSPDQIDPGEREPFSCPLAPEAPPA
jgi:hypothetical protein